MMTPDFLLYVFNLKFILSFFDSIFLGFLQGLTEFLPISSSGHLVIFEKILELEFDKTSLKGFDVVLHFGTLLAITFYFKTDLIQLFKGLLQTIKTRKCNAESQLFLNLIIATVPVLFTGFFFNDFLDEYFRSIKTISFMLFFTGLILLLSEKFPQDKKEKKITLKQGFLIGCAQAVALIPGVSRSGSTISMAMFQGIKRESAASFAFLMAVPAIFAAMGYILLKTFLGEIVFPEFKILVVGFIASFVSSYLCVKFLMHFIRKHALSMFSWYLFGASVLLIFFAS